MFWRPKRPEYLNRIIKLPARSGSRHGAPAPVAARAAADGSRDTRARHGPGDGDDLRGVGRRRGHHQQRGASGGVVPELAPRGGDEQHPGLVQHPRRVPGLRPRLHVRRPVPAGLRGGGARGRRIRRGAGARRRRGGGVGVRHRRHRPQQPPLLRRHGVRGSAVQRDLLRGVCGEGDGAGAAGGAKALREAAGAGHQGGLHHRQARVREGAHCQEPPQRRLPHLGEARAQVRPVWKRGLRKEFYRNPWHSRISPSSLGSSVVPYKSGERQKLVDAGYRIVGNIGDQWSDLVGAPEGDRTFKVPDPMYYVG
uniref:Acid phosphatase n=1 Tax=Setaria italica TaxID=4555 RepID=K3Z875_SETIT